ncbi:hypothetical protein ElyMa_000981600, partial [Elysia marginata]
MLSAMKRLTFLWGALLFMVTLLMLYMMLDTLNMGRGQGKMDTEVMTLLESKLSQVEKDMNDNRLIVQQIRLEMGSLLQPDGSASDNRDTQQVQAPAVVGLNRKSGNVLDMVVDRPNTREEETYSVAARGKGPQVSA